MDGSTCPGCQALQRRGAELEAQLASLQTHNASLQTHNAKLTKLLEAAQRAGKRQAAPFSKGESKPKPKRPGRKPGENYGNKGHRPPPPPEQIDEIREAPLPDHCPDCGGPIAEDHVVPQYQVEIPRKPINRQINVHIGRCQDCGTRVQGRHPLQTSNALGAAASQLGPDAQAAAVELNKNAGLPCGKVAGVLQNLFGITLSRGAVAHIVRRSARRCADVYAAIRQAVRTSPWVVPDETGWRVGGHGAWLHGLVGVSATAYVIASNRSGAVAANILGRDYDGVMTHDGWPPYDNFLQAVHQQCLQHLMRRSRELLETASRGAVRFPRRVLELLGGALHLRDRYAEGAISDHGLAVARGRLQRSLEDAVFPTKTNPANERLAQHLWNHRDQLLTFLRLPGIDATTWRAELAMRFGVILRKVWGGNRTWCGAWDQMVLMSVWRTCWQNKVSALDFLSRLLRDGRTGTAWFTRLLRSYPVALALPP